MWSVGFTAPGDSFYLLFRRHCQRVFSHRYRGRRLCGPGLHSFLSMSKSPQSHNAFHCDLLALKCLGMGLAKCNSRPGADFFPWMGQAPGWLKRPAGACFGFGGKLATFAKDPAGGRTVVKMWRLCLVFLFPSLVCFSAVLSSVVPTVVAVVWLMGTPMGWWKALVGRDR